ncbi:type VII secretion-associated protein [Corynebacterium epidermidicanis]|uniref:Type VII secretion-associated protein n=1 Tax=Corynebacterium epidermidicanis TaxID=1050174 RepID=A0A0G3GMF5_9CORY|nr:type VII secretion-associated protein [Corynebacterium epidermidicanis]AKK02324.1 type VII secretion-associated protein [Corynebacterium epidermidicanis]
MEKITITVLDTATVFDGPEHIYRYDLPGSGIVSGWALTAVSDQIKTIAGDHWPDIEVVISGEDPAVEMLTRTLLNKGLAAYPAEAIAQAEAPVEITRPTKGRNRTRSWRPSLFHAAIAVVIISVIGVSWWGLEAESTPQQKATSMPQSHDGLDSSQKSLSAVPAKPAENHGAAGAAGAAGKIVEHDRIRVQLPSDFTMAPREDGKLVAVGRDPNLRILIAVDPIYGVSPEAVRREVELMVSRDPALSPLASENLRGQTQTIDYHEDPGDGSNVRWVSWVEQEHQFSVGCHSRFEITVPHRATCRMAVDSVGLKN